MYDRLHLMVFIWSALIGVKTDTNKLKVCFKAEIIVTRENAMLPDSRYNWAKSRDSYCKDQGAMALNKIKQKDKKQEKKEKVWPLSIKESQKAIKITGKRPGNAHAKFTTWLDASMYPFSTTYLGLSHRSNCLSSDPHILSASSSSCCGEDTEVFPNQPRGVRGVESYLWRPLSIGIAWEILLLD